MNLRDFTFLTQGYPAADKLHREAIDELDKKREKIEARCDHKRPDGTWAIRFHTRIDEKRVYACILCHELIDRDEKDVMKIRSWDDEEGGRVDKKIGRWKPRKRRMKHTAAILLLAVMLLSAFAVQVRAVGEPGENTAAQVAEIEITPSTMPAEPGAPAPPPKVKVTLPPPILVPAPPDFGDDKWTPGNVAKLLGYALVLGAVGWTAWQVGKVKFGLQATAERVDRQGKTQEQQLIREGTGSGGPPKL